MQLASRFGHVNQIRRERPLTHRRTDAAHVPVFLEGRPAPPAVNGMRRISPLQIRKICGKAFSRSSPARPVCATRPAEGIYQTHAASAAGLKINGELMSLRIILLNSLMTVPSQLPDAAGVAFRIFVCQNRCVCSPVSEVRVPHREMW